MISLSKLSHRTLFLSTAILLLLWEIFFLRFIIRKVPYTEIDYRTYLQIAQQYAEGERNYENLKGESGPIAYPAGFLYLFSGIYSLCANDISCAQSLFSFFYVTQLATMMAIYWIGGATWWTLPLLAMSRRLHSIFVLRLFNDAPCMLLFHLALLFLLLSRKNKQLLSISTLFLSMALGIKMNVLLAAPAWALAVLSLTLNWTDALLQGGLFILIQVALAFPFLRSNWRAYLGIAFNFGRQFEWQWTVNWRFLGQPLFEALQFSGMLLPAVQLGLIIYLAETRWIPGLPSFFLQPRPMKERQIIIAIWECMLVGILLSRSLHYQFYSWYVLSLPFLASSCFNSILWTVGLFLTVEFCWNVFPSTGLSSLTLLVVHCSLLYLQKQ